MTQRNRLASALLLVILLVLPGRAADTPLAKPEDVGLSAERLARIGEMMKRHMSAREISGGVTLVARHGKIAHLDAQGAMDFDSKAPMAKDAVFRLASMTKVVTGVAVMMMMEEGKLRVTDPVSKYIPQFKDMKVAVAQTGPVVQDPPPAADTQPAPRYYTVPAERPITIRDLLTHTSGLVSGPMSNAEARKVERKPTETLADYIPRLGSTALEFQPGTRWAYSAQAGFDTLGRIVEIVSGQGFDQFLKQRLFDPLGMQDVSFYATDALARRMPTPYQLTANGGVEKNANPSWMQSPVYFMGAGGLISTAEDYAKFGQMLVNGGELNGRRILSPKTVEFMRAVHIPDTLPGRTPGEAYGLSVRVIDHGAKGAHRISDGSFGWSGAYGTHFWADPKEDLVAVLMIQTPIREMRPEFENLVMAAIVK